MFLLSCQGPLRCDESKTSVEAVKETAHKAQDAASSAVTSVAQQANKIGIPVPVPKAYDAEALKWQRTFDANAQEIDSEGVKSVSAYILLIC